MSNKNKKTNHTGGFEIKYSDLPTAIHRKVQNGATKFTQCYSNLQLILTMSLKSFILTIHNKLDGQICMKRPWI